MDPFHVVSLAGDKLDQCRRRIQRAITGRRGRAGDRLYRARRTLHTGASLLIDTQARRLEVLLAGEHHAPVQASGGVYQRLIQTYGADCPGLGKYLMQQAVPDKLGRSRPRPAPGNPLIVRTTAHEFCGHFSVRY